MDRDTEELIGSGCGCLLAPILWACVIGVAVFLVVTFARMMGVDI